MGWRIKHRTVTESTNKDAHGGEPGDVFTADFQTAGRGRLDHRWLSQSGANLMMSAVIDVEDAPPGEVATLPLVAGCAVAEAIASLFQRRDGNAQGYDVRIKWPNDVLIGGRKVCGILCERNGDNVIVGIGLNVNQKEFPEEIASRATSLLKELGLPVEVNHMRDAILERLASLVRDWRRNGFAAAWPRIAELDFLKGQTISVVRTDTDAAPSSGVCGGIQPDGSLDVGGVSVYAGEARISRYDHAIAQH